MSEEVLSVFDTAPGNSLGTGIEEVRITCDYCEGEGEVEITRHGLRRVLQAAYQSGFGYRFMMGIVRAWQANGGRDKCRECDGYGSWSELR